MVVLFADIVDFTRLVEDLDPEEATTLVNRCLDEMTTAVIRQGGRVDKYTGDGLVAIFGLSVAHEDDPQRALHAALAMQRQVADLHFDFEPSPILLHIGLACGQVVVARAGSGERVRHAVIGTSVNLAARLEAASAPGQILVGENVAKRAKQDFSFRPLVLPRQPGWEGKVRAFELLGERSQ